MTRKVVDNEQLEEDLQETLDMITDVEEQLSALKEVVRDLIDKVASQSYEIDELDFNQE